MDVLVTGKAYAISVENGIALSVRVFNVKDYHQTNLILRIEQIEDLNILLGDFSLLQVTTWRAAAHMYGFGYFRGILSVPFHPGLSTK